MASVESSAKGWKTAVARLALLIVIVLQPLEPGAGWTQEPVQPRIDEEFAKQEKIYRRRGADVPGSYVTNRGLSDYAEVLPTGFCDALGSLGSSDRWLDIGAGEGKLRVRLLLLDFLTFCFVHPAQALLNLTPQLLARDRRAIA